MIFRRSVTWVAPVTKQLILSLSIWSFAASPEPLIGREVQVATIDELQAALSVVSPGDKIVVADGKYTNPRPLKIAKAGTKKSPIEISAQTCGGVEITGQAGYTFESTAAYVVLSGFKFS